MKLLAPFEKLLTSKIIVLNLAILFAAEIAGEGKFFAETGLVHAVALIFVGLIFVRIFSDYAFSDYILRGFLKIQLSFFLFLGLIHVYEYFGLNVFEFNDEIVELSAMASYFLWIVGVLIALEFVFRIYYKKSNYLMIFLSSIVVFGFLVLLAANLFGGFAEALPEWLPLVMLASIVGFGVWGIVSMLKIRKIMPVFSEYSYYAISAMVIFMATAFTEYFESAHTLNTIGISDTQNLYISHFLIYAVLSILLVGFGKLKKPKGIYADM